MGLFVSGNAVVAFNPPKPLLLSGTLDIDGDTENASELFEESWFLGDNHVDEVHAAIAKVLDLPANHNFRCYFAVFCTTSDGRAKVQRMMEWLTFGRYSSPRFIASEYDGHSGLNNTYDGFEPGYAMLRRLLQLLAIRLRPQHTRTSNFNAGPIHLCVDRSHLLGTVAFGSTSFNFRGIKTIRALADIGSYEHFPETDKYWLRPAGETISHWFQSKSEVDEYVSAASRALDFVADVNDKNCPFNMKSREFGQLVQLIIKDKPSCATANPSQLGINARAEASNSASAINSNTPNSATSKAKPSQRNAIAQAAFEFIGELTGYGWLVSVGKFFGLKKEIAKIKE